MNPLAGALLLLFVLHSALPWPMPYLQLQVAQRSIPAIEPMPWRREAARGILNGGTELAVTDSGSGVAGENAGDVRHAARRGDESGSRRNCFAIGPVRDRARAVEISGRYAGRRVKTELKSSRDKHYLGVMVFVDGHASRAAAENTAAALAAHGIRDHIIINPEGRLHLLSLGVFGKRRNAERLRAQIERHGFPARLEPRFRERAVFFVFGEHRGTGGVPELLDGRDLADGIVRIPIPCPPS